MERLIEMLAVLALIYAGYALGIKRWSYAASQADREKRRTELKAQGLSNTFYFIHAGTLFFLILLSGGTFTFYWLYQQWKAVLHGFKRSDGTTLKYGPLVRTLAGAITFFSLGNIINRTCEYMHKTPAWPAAWWGFWWICGLVLLFCPVGILGRILGALLFCAAPVAFQHRLNALPKTQIPVYPKPKEWLATAFGLTIVVSLFLCLRLLLH